MPQALTFLTGPTDTAGSSGPADTAEAHAFYYPPTNPDFEAPAGEKPPLLVILHGGPTGASSKSLSLATQFWTSRGFALLDLNYRGSSGYGRDYRNLLNRAWGVHEVQDTVSGAQTPVSQTVSAGHRSD